MVNITLPDHSVRQFDVAVSIMDIAKNISASLAKATIAGSVDGITRDANYIIEHDANLTIINDKDELALDILRHSTAHLLAHAVKQLYPTAQVTIGPVIENGFYYDFSFERPFTPEDLLLIEKRMKELSTKNIPIKRTEVSRNEAVQYFLNIGEKYKAELIAAIPDTDKISLYHQDDWTDLCRGPHVPNLSKLKAFKLTKVAGAYWRGDSANEMLQRIYGTAWRTQEELDQYLHMLEEAQKRDHRKIGQQLDLFHLQDEAPGMVFWHANGWLIWQAIEQYMRHMYGKYDYQEIKTPQVVDRSLWEKSGHWDKFYNDMFSLSIDEKQYAIKPMNCPCHVQIFKHKLVSYRELPMRFGEFGSCHRNEASGALQGLMRVRSFVQDDGHIFCTQEQIESEVCLFIDMVFEVYTKFALNIQDIQVNISTRPVQRIGSDAVWDLAEQSLINALKVKQMNWKLQPGEGAFYGPKIEFAIKDCIGRVWTTGSIQLDFSMPERLGATYIATDSSKKTPVMLHRAICGSLERFIGILIEHHNGHFPLWLAPKQVALLNISEQQINYTQQVYTILKQAGIRCVIDLSNEKISYKIREQTLQKIPYLIIIGDKEVANQTLSIRANNATALEPMSVEHFIQHIHNNLS